jgi:hypothetical protein
LLLDCWSSVVRSLENLHPLAAILGRAGWRNKTKLHLTLRYMFKPDAGANVASPTRFLMSWLVSVSEPPMACEEPICNAWFCTPSC